MTLQEAKFACAAQHGTIIPVRQRSDGIALIWCSWLGRAATYNKHSGRIGVFTNIPARDNWEVVNAADHDWLLSFLRKLSYECPVLSALYEAAYGSS